MPSRELLFLVSSLIGQRLASCSQQGLGLGLRPDWSCLCGDAHVFVRKKGVLSTQDRRIPPAQEPSAGGVGCRAGSWQVLCRDLGLYTHHRPGARREDGAGKGGRRHTHASHQLSLSPGVPRAPCRPETSRLCEHRPHTRPQSRGPGTGALGQRLCSLSAEESPGRCSHCVTIKRVKLGHPTRPTRAAPEGAGGL